MKDSNTNEEDKKVRKRLMLTIIALLSIVGIVFIHIIDTPTAHRVISCLFVSYAIYCVLSAIDFFLFIKHE